MQAGFDAGSREITSMHTRTPIRRGVAAEKSCSVRMKKRDPGLASVFSFLLPGLGQIYTGKMGWGIFHFLAHVGLLIVSLALSYPLIFADGSIRQRLTAWLSTPSNLGIAFGLLFLLIGNWIWSFLTAAQNEDEDSDSKDITSLIETARSEYYAEAAPTGTPSAAYEKTAAYETLVQEQPVESKSFAITLAEIMDLKGVGIEDLSEITGIPETEITKYLKGSKPDDATVKILARGLNVSPRFLTGESTR